MNNTLKLIVISLMAFVFGLGVNNFAMSDVPSKIAVVDVAAVVSKSTQVKNLKMEQEKKVKNLADFVAKARKEVAAESNVTKKQELEAKYNKELKTRKTALDKEFNQKLAGIDKNISAIIKKEAESKGYDVVLAKGVVLYGGTDITSAISKAVK